MNSLKNSKGFTIVELMVVITVILLISSIGTNVYKSQRIQLAHNNTVLSVLNMIKTARNYAVSSRPIYDESIINPADRQFVPAEGYGVYIQRSDVLGSSTAILFANTQASNDIETDQYDPGTDIIVETYNISDRTEFPNILEDLTPTALADEVVIIFRGPLADATLAINDPSLVTSAAMIRPDNIYLELRRLDTYVDIPSQYIHINKVSGIAEIN